MAGIRPANAPIRMAEAMPPDHASCNCPPRHRTQESHGVESDGEDQFGPPRFSNC
jgi:hypothetical protein